LVDPLKTVLELAFKAGYDARDTNLLTYESALAEYRTQVINKLPSLPRFPMRSVSAVPKKSAKRA